MNGWIARHLEAMDTPRPVERPHVLAHNAIREMIDAGWDADCYAREYVIEAIRAARGLLNMESGRLDCGTLDSIYCAWLRQCGLEDSQF